MIFKNKIKGSLSFVKATNVQTSCLNKYLEEDFLKKSIGCKEKYKRLYVFGGREAFCNKLWIVFILFFFVSIETT